MKLFQYYMIRPAVDFGDETVSYLGRPEYHPGLGAKVFTHKAALREAEKEAGDLPIIWTIYGVDQDSHQTAIGDFVSYEAALETLHAMLVPFRRAIDADSWAQVEDILNQSTNEDRL